MARRRRPDADRDIRAGLSATLRRQHVEYQTALHRQPDEIGACHVADALDRGEAVTLAAWQLPRGAWRGLAAAQRVTVEPDGTVIPAGMP